MKYNTKNKKNYRFDMKVCSVLFAKITKDDMIAQPQTLLFKILKYLRFIFLTMMKVLNFPVVMGN